MASKTTKKDTKLHVDDEANYESSSPERQSNTICIEKYATVEERLGSFQALSDQEKEHMPDIVVLAENGFYYTGRDEYKCYACKGQFRSLLKEENINVIHGSRYPDCPHVKAFIKATLRPYERKRTSPVEIEKDARHIAAQHGCSSKMVDEACKVLRSSELPITAGRLMDEIHTQERMEDMRQENARMREKLLCKVCLVQDIDATIKECNHCICTQCGKRCKENRLGCPWCRGFIKNIVPMFMS